MNPIYGWIPMRWPSGSFWSESSALQLLDGSPFNCVVLPWGQNRNQAASAGLIAEARRRGVDVVGLLEAQTDMQSVVAAAQAAGLSALAGAPPLASASDMPIIAWGPRSVVGRALTASVLAASDGVWPAVKLSSRGAQDTVDVGPTGAPWIDANGWAIRLLQAQAPGKPVWIAAGAPESADVTLAGPYVLAAAEACAYGGRSVVTLDPGFAASLASGEASAREEWKRLCDSLTLLEKHRERQQYEEAGVLGVLSDFAGDDEFFATELLNLLSRSQIPFRIVLRDRIGATSLDGLKALLFADVVMPDAAVQKQLQSFTSAGGLLICRRQCAALAAGSTRSAQSHPRFEVHLVGEGRIAVAMESDPDPFLVAEDAQILLSHRNDPLRLGNRGAVVSHYRLSPDGDKGLLVLLNYAYTGRQDTAGRGGGRMALASPEIPIWLARPFRSARLWTLEAGGPAEVPVSRRGDAVELHVPPFGVYAAIELET